MDHIRVIAVHLHNTTKVFFLTLSIILLLRVAYSSTRFLSTLKFSRYESLNGKGINWNTSRPFVIMTQINFNECLVIYTVENYNFELKAKAF